MNNEYVHWILGAFKKRALHLAHALAFSLPLINKTELYQAQVLQRPELS
jgi:hypothetical protein